MDYFHNRYGTLLRGAVLFTLVLTGGCLSGGGGGGSGGGSSGSGSTVTLSSGSSSLIPVIINPSPTVERVNPEASSTGAVITAIVLAQFDREMDAVTIDSDSFTLTGPNLTGPNGIVPGTVSCDNPCRTARFEPADPLAVKADYTAMLSDTITDANGIPLAADVVWLFSTAPEMVRASMDVNGVGGIQASQNAATDKSGRFVAFDSTAKNLVPGDGNGASDVFVKDTQTGEIERVSVSADEVEGDGPSRRPAISADGRYVAFESGATNLVSGLGTLVPVHIYVKDRETGSVTLVSADDSGNASNGNSTNPSISADGRYVAFESNADNLVTLPQNAGTVQIYVKELQTEVKVIELASAEESGTAGRSDSTSPAISADGQFVAFQSASDNFGADGGLETQIFRKELQTDELLLALVSATDSDVRGDGVSTNPTISGDGQFVAFETRAPNLQGIASPNAVQIVRKDTEASSDSLVIASADEQTGDPGDLNSLAPSISDDGRYVAFHSLADLVGSTNQWLQVYVKDLENGADGPIEVVSLNASDDLGNGSSERAAIARDGGYVAFQSAATELILNDLNDVADVFRGLNDTFLP